MAGSSIGLGPGPGPGALVAALLELPGGPGWPSWDDGAAEALLDAVAAVRRELGALRGQLIEVERMASDGWHGAGHERFVGGVTAGAARLDELAAALTALPQSVERGADEVVRARRHLLASATGLGLLGALATATGH